MITLPRLAPNALSDTHTLLSRELLSFDNLDKKFIGTVATFYNESGDINLSELGAAVSLNDVAKTDVILNSAHTRFRESFSHFYSDTDDIVLGGGFEISSGYPEPIAEISNTSMSGYDIKPLSTLSSRDALITAKTVGLSRSTLTSYLLPEDIEEFSSYRVEEIDMLMEWLPKKLHKASDEAVLLYCEKNKDDASVDFDLSDESLLEDYFDRRIKRPAWYKHLSGVSSDINKLKLLSSLDRQAKTMTNKAAKAFVIQSLQSIREFIQSFDSEADFNVFIKKSDFDQLDGFNDNHPLEFGFLFTWGSDGYWWGVASDLNDMLANADEYPAYIYPIKTHEDRTVFRKTSERFHRGAAILGEMANLAHSLANSRGLA